MYNPTKCLAWEPNVGSTFLRPPAHLCALTYNLSTVLWSNKQTSYRILDLNNVSNSITRTRKGKWSDYVVWLTHQYTQETKLWNAQQRERGRYLTQSYGKSPIIRYLADHLDLVLSVGVSFTTKTFEFTVPTNVYVEHPKCKLCWILMGFKNCKRT